MENNMIARSSRTQHHIKDMQNDIHALKEALTNIPDHLNLGLNTQLHEVLQDVRLEFAGSHKKLILDLKKKDEEIDSLRGTIEHELEAVNWRHDMASKDVNAQLASLRSDQATGHEKADDVKSLQMSLLEAMEALEGELADAKTRNAAIEGSFEKFKTKVVVSDDDTTSDLNDRIDEMSAAIAQTQDTIEAIEMSMANWISEAAVFQAGMEQRVSGIQSEAEQRMSNFEWRMKKGSKKIFEALLEVSAAEQEVEPHNLTPRGIESMYSTEAFNSFQSIETGCSSSSSTRQGLPSPLCALQANITKNTQNTDKENCAPRNQQWQKAGKMVLGENIEEISSQRQC
jgi:hypothetical protein